MPRSYELLQLINNNMKIIQYKVAGDKIIFTHLSDKSETNIQASQEDNVYELTNEGYFCRLTGVNLIELSSEGEKKRK